MYGAAASWRRRWYGRDPSRQHHLSRPVISVGNVRVGGTGKTPVVAHLCELLVAHGERPAILSRGYARTRPGEGVTIVSDGKQLQADVASAGDEPLMLARLLPTVPVLVGSSRFECGQRAERDFDVTVHVLDDGFQHVTLARDIDLVLVDESDLSDHVLPAGRLREPLANTVAAHALLVTADDAHAVTHVAHAVGVSTAFQVQRAIHKPRPLRGSGELHAAGHSIAFAGIAKPERFFAELSAAGRVPAATLPFPDHHPFTQRDVDRIVGKARSVGATLAFTTEKDAMRLDGLDFKELQVYIIPLSITIEPTSQFQAWLFTRLHPSDSSAAKAGLSTTHS